MPEPTTHAVTHLRPVTSLGILFMDQFYWHEALDDHIGCTVRVFWNDDLLDLEAKPHLRVFTQWNMDPICDAEPLSFDTIAGRVLAYIATQPSAAGRALGLGGGPTGLDPQPSAPSQSDAHVAPQCDCGDLATIRPRSAHAGLPDEAPQTQSVSPASLASALTRPTPLRRDALLRQIRSAKDRALQSARQANELAGQAGLPLPFPPALSDSPPDAPESEPAAEAPASASSSAHAGHPAAS